jgi:UDP-N-acetylglucosamine--N-acetylmuramyl-(pentapeptide) pyrophosphoryl-undecaprenol N-acetylglucosamine transferase
MPTPRLLRAHVSGSVPSFPKIAQLAHFKGARPRIAICGGGTAGHVITGIAVADALKTAVPGAEILFVGGHQGLEQALVPASYRLERVPCTPLATSTWAGKAWSVVQAVRGAVHARRLLRDHRIQLAIGVGAYASVPGMLAAVALGIPTAIVEVNAGPGLANRLLGRFAKRIYLGAFSADAGFPDQRTIRTGVPIRREIASPPPLILTSRSAARPSRVLVCGGSLGSSFLNGAVPALLDRLVKNGVPLRVVHQTGGTSVQVAAAYATLGIKAAVQDYFPDFPARLRGADFVIASPGALTLAEVSTLGIPCLLVPDPHAAANHQAANAENFSRLTGCLTCRSDEWNLDYLAPELQSRLTDKGRLRRDSSALRRLASGDAAERLVADCLTLLPVR